MQATHRIRIGNQSSFAASTVTAPFEFAVASGFDAFEWFPDMRDSGRGWSDTDLDTDARARIRSSAAEHDIRLSVHASWQANPLEAAGQEILSRQIEFAQELGASLFNIHLYAGQGVEPFVRAVIPFAERLTEAGMRLSIENTPSATPGHFNELFSRLREDFVWMVDYIGMCFDCGHANLCAATRNDYLRYFDLLEGQVPVIHVHLHENYGDQDSHLLLFTGPAGRDPSGIEGFIRRLEKRRYAGALILEQWPQPPAGLVTTRQRLSALLDQTGGEGQAEAASEAAVMPAPESVTSADNGDFIARLARGNEENRSWREKLGFVYDILTDDTVDLDEGKLACLAIYLRFVGTGEIASLEEGGHHRPSHHARMAGRIYERLREISAPGNNFILRKIYPWLPSFDSAFTRAEPLTRIRDIAHRNDIPRDLKTEIKHTLQNKLHRNAGPEDLDTSKALLERITDPASSYPVSFVKEFIRFHEELEEFFHARSLEKELEALASEGGPSEESNAIQDFLSARERMETPLQLANALERLTVLRQRLSEQLEARSARAQQIQIVDIRLEDFSFVILSGLARHFQSAEFDWKMALHSLGLSMAGLRFSGFDTEECLALEAEFAATRKVFGERRREDLLRSKASLDRCSRLSEDYSDRIIELYSGRVERLGAALGVPKRAREVFIESDIRGHPVFQILRMSSALTRKVRELAGLPQLETIVPGTARGRLVPMEKLECVEKRADRGSPVIALLKKAEGDEVIPEDVAGVVVAHEVPRLSHLAVRARQRKTPFVVCEAPELWRELEALAGRLLVLEAGGDGAATWKVIPDSEDSGENRTVSSRRVRAPQVELSGACSLLGMGEVTLRNAGSKAYAGKQLEILSGRRGAAFEVPTGKVVPFCVMEDAIRSDKGRAGRYHALIQKADSSRQEESEEAVRQLRELVLGLDVPGEVLSGIEKEFRAHTRLMVRSSSNCEDLEDFPGAGLYESAANVPAAEAAAAIKQVWASLWTKRAAASRKACGIAHDQAHMAVYLQPMLVPDLSFILHTLNPISRNPAEVYMELAVGLGETLASGRMQGSPYRVVYDERAEELRILSFASFSKAAVPGVDGGIRHQTVDYSRIPFTRDAGFRRRLAMQLGKVGKFVEDAFGKPRDIEGAYVDGTIYLLQSRPQQGG